MALSTPWEHDGQRSSRGLSYSEFVHQRFVSDTPIGTIGQWVECFTIAFSSPASKKEMVPLLEQAWTAMRHRFPTITAQVEEGRMVYRSLADDELAPWLSGSFCVHTGGTVDEVFANLTRPAAIALHYFPDSSNLMLQSPHTHIDGRGACALWQALFETMSDSRTSKHLGSGQDIQHLPPADDRLFPLNKEPSEKLQDHAEEAVRHFGSESAIGIPTVDKKAAPAANRRVLVKLSRSSTQAVIDACKAHKLSVTSIWHAANALSIAKLQSNAASADTVFCPLSVFDVRQFARTPYSTDEFTVLMAANTFPIPVIDPASRSLIDLAQDIQAQYRQTFSGEGGTDLIKSYAAAMRALAMSGGPKAPNSAPIISSMGVIERFLKTSYAGGWSIDDFWVAETMAKSWPLSLLWTFDGRLTFSASYNEAHYAPDTVNAFVEGVKGEMLKGLGVSD